MREILSYQALGRKLAGLALLLALAPMSLLAGANMRRDGPLTLNQTSDDRKGFYSATIDASNGFAYFAAKYVYKVNLTTPLPTQVGAGVSLGNLAYSGVMDPSAGCAYFGVGGSIYQILANGTNAPSLGTIMYTPFSGTPFITQLLIDPSDPSNHYLYVMTENGTSSTLYKIALNNYPNANSIIGSASTTGPEPALGYGAIDLTNHCAYYGPYIPTVNPTYLVKFWLGAGTNTPVNYGSTILDTETNRSTSQMSLDIANGYGYCASDGNDLSFGHGRVYKWALNGTNAPALVSYVDMHTNEGYCHVTAIKPDRGLLYFSSDLSYPAYVYRYRLPAGTNAPVETGNLPLLGSTNTVLPAWGTNPTNSSEWGEVFARSLIYDQVRDYIYIGRDCADAQLQPFTNQIVKVALDRDEAMVMLTQDAANMNNTIPYSESFESYTNGFDLADTNGWYAEDTAMAVVATNNYAGTYSGTFPIPGAHLNALEIDGAVTNRFSPSANTNVWVDMILEAEYWTDTVIPALTNTPFALCVTTNGHLAVWNCTNAPAAGNGWTELLDTSVASNQFVRVTIKADYTTNAQGFFYYGVWVNGVQLTNPLSAYTAASTTQDSFGDVAALGHFALDDLVVGNSNPFVAPVITISSVTRNANGSISLLCEGAPNTSQRAWATASLSPPVVWQPISTNVAGADGLWQVTDTNTAGFPMRFYRASLP